MLFLKRSLKAILGFSAIADEGNIWLWNKEKTKDKLEKEQQKQIR